MNVLSLFDGMSCGQIALNKAGIQYDQYFASEIDKFPMKVTMHNYPNTIQVGDITKLNGSDLPKIDLLIGGSPCQGFSYAGKQLNFEDPRSILFFEYVRLLKETKPTYFLLENVGMKQEYQDVITEHLGVSPIAINSRLVSAQERKRLYWTNIPGVEVPEDRGVKFSDIVSDGGFCGAMRGRRIDEISGSRSDYNQNIPIRQYIESRSDDKSNCLTTVQKDNVVIKTKGPRRYLKDVEYRYLTPNEYEALQTVPKDYTACVSDSQRRRMMGNGWTIEVIVHILKNIKNGKLE